ncbi:MAG: hypothetical protein M3Y56_13530 [Armatimonadota bacterium]|nr:hypothetical protein [Armatimonadota bacterium]
MTFAAVGFDLRMDERFCLVLDLTEVAHFLRYRIQKIAEGASGSVCPVRPDGKHISTDKLADVLGAPTYVPGTDLIIQQSQQFFADAGDFKGMEWHWFSLLPSE